MLLITEMTEDVQCRLTEGKDGNKDYYIEGITMQGGIENRNGRMYPVSVLENEINRYVTEKVEKNRAFGELGHPQGPTINLDRVSHMFTSLQKEGDNFVSRAKVITENPQGAIVKGLIDAGASFGISSRGMGSLELKNGINEVQADFKLATAGDIVADPSAPDAFVNGIMEGAEWILRDEQWVRMAETAKNQVKALKTGQITEENMLKIFNDFCSKL